MLKKIDVNFELDLHEGVLIKNKNIKINMELEDIRKKALSEAELILSLANKEAEELAKIAYANGYQKGMIDALTHCAKYITNYQIYFKKTQNKMLEDVRLILSKSLMEPDVFASIFNEWLLSIPEIDETIKVYIPADYHIDEEEILSKIKRDCKNNITISFYDGRKYVLSQGDQIAEFAPDVVVQEVNEHLLQKYELIPDDLARISNSELDNFIAYCESLRTVPQDSDARNSK